jgi:hypothetical protein
MPVVNPTDYINQMTGNVEKPVLEDDSFEENLGGMNYMGETSGSQDDGGRSVLLAQAQNQGATPYNGYENDGLNYSKNMFADDTIDSVENFLTRMRLTMIVKNKFSEVYKIAASQDNVLTWSNAWLLQRRANMFKLQMLEFKNTLLGPDADSLLFGDFDLVIEIMTARLEARNGRSFEGFERKAGVTNYTYSHQFDNAASTATAQAKERSGLSKLGKFNPFRGI